MFGVRSMSAVLVTVVCLAVQVQVFRMSTERGSLNGVVPACCSRYPATHFATIFEVLAKTLSTKARELAQHISRHSINVSFGKSISTLF